MLRFLAGLITGALIAGAVFFTIMQTRSNVSPPQASAPAQTSTPPETAKTPEPDLRAASFEPVAWNAVPGWAEDDHAAALSVFAKSCASLGEADQRHNINPRFGTQAQWRVLCAAAASAGPDAARRFFEQKFDAFRVIPVSGRTLVTGYFEPQIDGASAPSGRFTAPAYARPRDLVAVDPVAFRDILKGERLAGKVADGMLVPYDARADIAAGTLAARADVLGYFDPVDLFILEIQGSGLARFDDGRVLRLAYAAQNGRPYTAIGRKLVADGFLERGKVTMQAIRAWLKDNPGKAQEVMNANASYVFFRLDPVSANASGPLGAEGLPLTAGRSLAVDARVYPYGLPIFVTAEIAAADGQTKETLRRLMIAQDTGGAIRGAVRGDVYFGTGPEAEARAGATAGDAGFVVLAPKGVTPAFIAAQ